MRKSSMRSGVRLLADEQGQVYGANLGSDFCAEHEWGTARLAELFGLDATKLGLEASWATKAPNPGCVVLASRDDGSHRLVVSHVLGWDGTAKAKLEKGAWAISELESYHGENTAAWNESSFGIEAHSPEAVDLVRALYHAILDVKFGFWRAGNGSPFGAPGLVVAVMPLVPQAIYDEAKVIDLDHRRLQDTAKATGIYELMAQADKRYYACTPHWKDDSKTEIIFWLNPMAQDRDNYGWFELKDLQDWIAGKGRIPMTDAQLKKYRERRLA